MGLGGFSLDGSNQRKLYDYTNGYDGGSNNSVDTHTKLGSNNELGFFCPEDGRQFHVISASGLKAIHTIKFDGTNLLQHALASMDQVIHPIVWVRDSDLCVFV